MYQLIFRHYGADEVDGFVQVCIEQDLEDAKILVHSWMLAYVEYVRKCDLNDIDENPNLTVEEKFFNEYTYGGSNDKAEMSLYKLRTMRDLEKTFEIHKGDEDFMLLQNTLFDPIYKVRYSKEDGIKEIIEDEE